MLRKAADLDEAAKQARQAARQVAEAVRSGHDERWVTVLHTVHDLRLHFNALQEHATAQIRAWDRLPHINPREVQAAAQPGALARGSRTGWCMAGRCSTTPTC